MSSIRVLDLACAHGLYAIEFARRGAQAVGIEGRQAWVDHANLSKSDSKLSNVEFFLDDVRNLSREKYGSFDVVLCLGLLYHLDAPDCFEMIQSISNVCTAFAVVDTQVAIRQPTSERHWRGKSYRGWPYREHLPDASNEQKTATMGASLDDEFSFWMTKSSLLNVMRHSGFTSVVECLNPVDLMYQKGSMKMHEDFVTLLGIKGQPVGPFLGMTPERCEEDDWPENPSAHYLVRPWS